jgi:hypothetical protein
MMTDEFGDVVKNTSEYLTTLFITRLVGFVLWLSMLMSIIVIFINIPLMQPFSGIVLLLLILLIIVSIVRLSWWIYKLLKSYWLRFKPPYNSEGFRFQLLYNRETYEYVPVSSPVRLAIGLTIFMSFLWMGFQILIDQNIHHLVEFIGFLVDIVPDDSLGFADLVSQFFIGVPVMEIIENEERLKTFIRFLLWIPNILCLCIVLWNAIYGVEHFIIVDEIQSNEEFDSPEDKKIFLPLRKELDSLRWWAGKILEGVESGLADVQIFVIKAGLIPIFIMYVLILFFYYI